MSVAGWTRKMLAIAALVVSVGAAHAIDMKQAAQTASNELTSEAIDAQVKAATEKEKANFKTGTTLENLIAAYNGESNASAKYAAFAKKADEEGYGAVASLFRAASKAETVHAENHAEVIKRLGGTPVADVKKVEPKTTQENLLAALEGESFERDVMYADYMKVARQDRLPDAVKTINYALTAEKGHAKKYKEDLEQLVKMKDSSGQVYYVCPTCGYTVSEEEYKTFTKCPVCFTSAKTFEEVK